MQQIIDKCRSIANLPQEVITLDHPDVFFLVKNGPENILSVLNTSSSLCGVLLLATCFSSP